MGLFDGTGGSAAGLLNQATGIGGALGNAQDMNATQYNQMMQQQQLAMQQQQLAMAQQGVYNQAAQRRVQAGTLQGGKQFNPNEHEAFQIPLSQLVTMWRLKFEDRWIRPTEEFPRFDGEFYSVAFDRMAALSMFENYQGWARLKEDA